MTLDSNTSGNAIVGIDLAVRKGKRLPVVVVVRENNGNRILPLRNAQVKPPKGPGNAALIEDAQAAATFARETVEYVRWIEQEYGVKVLIVVIDSPLSPADEDKIRDAERCLDKLGLSYFRTPSLTSFEMIRKKRHAPGNQSGANQIWMLAGFQLFTQISAAGIKCVETYPFAVCSMWGIEHLNKESPLGKTERMNAIARCIGVSPAETLQSCCFGAGQDKVDAMICACVGNLESIQRTDIGTSEHPFWLPTAHDRK